MSGRKIEVVLGLLCILCSCLLLMLGLITEDRYCETVPAEKRGNFHYETNDGHRWVIYEGFWGDEPAGHDPSCPACNKTEARP